MFLFFLKFFFADVDDSGPKSFKIYKNFVYLLLEHLIDIAEQNLKFELEVTLKMNHIRQPEAPHFIFDSK